MRILILTANAGNGHNSAAKRIKEEFLHNQPKAEIEIVDTYREYASNLKEWLQTKGYLLICNYGVSLYNFFFKKCENSHLSCPDKNPVNKNSYPLMFGILNKILNFKPDLIISTYIFNSIALSNIERIIKLPCKIASLTLDYGISPYWECIAKNTDYMFLTDEYMIKPFIRKGFNPKNLYVTGIPVSSQFLNSFNSIQSKKELNLNPNVFTLLVMKSGFFSIKERELVKCLNNITTTIQIIIINGNDKKSKEKIDYYVKKYKIKHTIYNLNYIDNIPKYFSASDLLLSKAGGLTLTESLVSALPSLIISKLPIQEEYNKQFMIKNNCAISVNQYNLANTINDLIANKSKLEILKHNNEKVRKENSVNKIYTILKDCPLADYSNTSFPVLNKRQLIKKVNKSRKSSIKAKKLI